MQVKCLTLYYAHPLPFGLGKKARHRNCANKHILIELSVLICFGYDLGDTQDGLRCWKMGFIFCGKQSFPQDNDSGERPRVQ